MIDPKLQEQLDRSVTVEELHQYLEQLIENGHGSPKIMISQPTHDYWKTKVAQPIIIGHINPGNIKYTGYHNAAQVVNYGLNEEMEEEVENSEGEDNNEPPKEIEVIEVILFNHC